MSRNTDGIGADQFGQTVMIHAEVLRVIGTKNGTGPVRFRHLNPQRFGGRYVQRGDFHGERTWPGEPIPLDHPNATKPFGVYELEPTFDEVDGLTSAAAVRLRRFPCPMPRFGIVLGTTHRQEGKPQTGGYEDPGYLNVQRDVALVDVALQPLGSGKAWLALALRTDLTTIEMGADA